MESFDRPELFYGEIEGRTTDSETLAPIQGRSADLASPLKALPSYSSRRLGAVAIQRPAGFTQEQIAALYVDLRSPLFASLRRWKLSVEEGEDIVQEAFVRLLSNSPDDLSVQDARYWLFRVAHNLAIDHRRSGWSNLLDSQADFDLLVSARASPGADPERIYLHREQWRMLRNNLAKLTPRQQYAIYMRIMGLSYKAIADQLRSTSNSVGELIRRALKRLGEKVDAPAFLKNDIDP